MKARRGKTRYAPRLRRASPLRGGARRFWFSVYAFSASIYISWFALPVWLHLSRFRAHEVSLIMGCFAAAAVVGRLPVAWLLARFGTVRLLWAGAWTSALAFLPVLLFSELPCALYGARLGQGLALAAFNSAVYVHLDGLSGETRRGELISSFGLTANLAMMSAPPFGQALLDRGGIAWVHGGAFTLALACALTLPRARAGKTFTTALLLWDPRALGPSMCMLGIAASYGALMLSAPLIAEARAIPAGWTFFTAYGLAILATRLGTRRWLDRFERRPFVLTGAVLLGAALVNLSLASNQLGLITSALLFGAGIGIGHPTLMARILETVPPLNRAAATTMGAVAFDGGSALGMLFAGEIAQRISWPAALSGVAGLLGVSLLPLLRSSQPQLGVRP